MSSCSNNIYEFYLLLLTKFSDILLMNKKKSSQTLNSSNDNCIMDTASSSHAIAKKYKPKKSKNNRNTSNGQLDSSIELIELEDKTDSFEVINISDDEVININDTTFNENHIKPGKMKVFSKRKFNDISLVNISDTSSIDGDDHQNSKKNSSNQIVPFYDDIQIIDLSNCAQHNQIEIITISDNSDEEETPRQCFNNYLIGAQSNEERISSRVNPLKRRYNSRLRNFRKKAKFETKHKPKTLPINYLENINTHEFQSTTVLQPHQSSLSNKTSNTGKQLRPIIIDGLNIGFAHGAGTFSVEGIQICLKYFVDRGHETTIFIPHHRQGPPRSKSNIVLNALHKKGLVCFTPSRKVKNLRMTCYDDRIMLNYACRCGGVIVSNDNYRDLYEESEAFKEIIEQRQVMVTFVKNVIIVPDDQYNLRHCVRSLSDILCFP